MVAIKEKDGNIEQFDLDEMTKNRRMGIHMSSESQYDPKSYGQYRDNELSAAYRTHFILLQELFDDFLKNLHSEIKPLILTQPMYSQFSASTSMRFKRSDVPVICEDDGEVVDLIYDKNKIEEIIIKNTIPGEDFYPEEIAFKFNLDLKITMQVIQKLIEDGVISE